jgi:hypothetical protein
MDQPVSNASADTVHDILVDIGGWASRWSSSESNCQRLRRHALYPPDTEVRLGVRAVRFRLSKLDAFAAALASANRKAGEPERLKRGRLERKAQRDVSAVWIPSQAGAGAQQAVDCAA